MLTESRILKAIIVSASLLIVAACSSSPSSTTRSSGSAPMSASDAYQATRYKIQQDRASSQILDIGQVREVIPRLEPRTMAGNKSPYTVNGKTYRVMESEQGYRERGFASWYGEKFHGHKTSNGEIYDMFQLSAAHKSMPIPGFMRVTNLENNRSIVVRVNDRGPFHSERIVDLSYAAAYMLGFDAKGTAMVEVEAIVPSSTATRELSPPRTPVLIAPQQAGGTILQIGAFSDFQAAQQLTMRLQALTSRPVFIRSVEIGEQRELIHRVRVGPIPDVDEISRITDSVVAANLGRPYTVRE